MRHLNVALGLVISGLPVSAWAGASLCQSATPVPPSGSTIPANAPAVGLKVGWVPTSTTPGETRKIDQVQLLDSFAMAWPLRSDSRGPVLQPTPFTVGASYQLSYADACAEMTGEAAAQTSSFTAGPAVALPDVVGTVVTSANRRATLDVWGSDYVMTVDGSYVDVALSMTPEMKAYAPLATFFIESVDGQTRPFAEVAAVFAKGTTSDGAPCFRAVVSCGPAPVVRLNPQLAEGEHSITIGATIFGGAVAPASATTTMRLSCGAAAATKDVSRACNVASAPVTPIGFHPEIPNSDGGAIETPSSTATVTTTSTAAPTSTATATAITTTPDSGTASPAPTATDTATSGHSGCGCALSYPGRAGTAILFAFAAVTALLRRRR
jgi:hypothetical protein